MRGEASRIADRVSRDSLAPKLRDSGEDAWRIGNELFTITNVLDHNIQLERALTDPPSRRQGCGSQDPHWR